MGTAVRTCVAGWLCNQLSVFALCGTAAQFCSALKENIKDVLK